MVLNLAEFVNRTSILREPFLLFLVGACLSISQFVMIRDFVAILYGEEVVIILVTAAFFLGLSIGFHDIKIVELVRTEKGFQITKFAIKEIPASILQQKDRTGLLAEFIKKMFADAKIKGRQVYLSITGHNVIIRNATLPKMPDAELADVAKWNAKEDALFGFR
jgi:hypothetical protein